MKNVLVVFLFVTMLGGCASTGEKTIVQSDCAPNFTEEGNIFTGKMYNSFKDFPNASKEKAFDRVLSTVASRGWQVINSNKDIGLISVAQGVVGGKGSTSPMNVMINSAGKGIRVEITRKVDGGQIASSDGIANTFCAIFNSVSK